MSNNVGIDFTELGPPYGTKAGQAAPITNEKDTELITIGFRVKPKEKAIIQDYCNRMFNQYIIDPTTNQPKRMLDSPSIGLMVKIASFAYLTQFNWFMKTMEQAQAQQQQQQNLKQTQAQMNTQVPANGPMRQQPQQQQGYGNQPQR